MSNQFTISNNVELSREVESIVAMAVYAGDRQDWTARAVESMLAQDYHAYLFVIVVDGEVDAQILAYLENVAAGNPHVMLVRGARNVGLSQCMNYVIDYALDHHPEASYFFRMDADDISERSRLSSQVNFLNQNKEISVLGSSLVEINEKGKVVGQRHLPLAHEQIVKVFPRRCALNHPTVAVRMVVFAQGFRYLPTLMNTQDYFLWIELCSKGFQFANLPDTLLKFRRVNDFYKRRGLNKSVNEFKARFYAMRALGAMTPLNIIYAIAVIVLRVMPARLIKLAYKIDRYFLNK